MAISLRQSVSDSSFSLVCIHILGNHEVLECRSQSCTLVMYNIKRELVSFLDG
jgi:hypothetical protein